MSVLELVADGAYPHPPYDFLPADTKAWGGYLGGHTVHAWTKPEVAEVEAAGLAWWGIWTAVQGRALTAADATADAAGALAALAALDRPKLLPVFYDVEYSTWAAGPIATTTAAQQWCSIMRSSGYPNADWYGPCGSLAPWRACWTGTRPDSLPTGAVGVQYDHALAGDRFDISVFDPSKFSGGIMTSPSNWTPADDNHVRALFTGALNQGTGAGQSSWAETEQAILGTVQQLINEGRSQSGTLIKDVAAAQTAVIGYLAGHPVTATLSDVDRQSIATSIVAQFNAAGVQVDPKPILDALAVRLTA